MSYSKTIKTKQILILLCLSFGLILPILSKNIPITNLYKKMINIDSDHTQEQENFYENMLKSAEPLDFYGNGEKMNITLHQALVDPVTKQFSNLDSSNSFTEPFPDFSGYSTSFINMTVDNIFAPNKSLIIEDDSGGAVNLGNYYTSFRVRGDCYLEEISVYLFTTGTATTFTFDLYGATQSGSYTKFDINNDLTGAGNLGTLYNNSVTRFWYNISDIHIYLDVSDTYDNTFFVRISTDNGQGRWRSEDESDGDDTISWEATGGTPEPSLDLTLKVELSPNNTNIPNPSDINLRINNTAVSDISNGQGYWNPLQKYTSVSNQIEFEITSDWYDLSCDITSVSINYTKSDLKADSSFDIIQSGDFVQWNITRLSGLNYFDSRITDFNTINFTIPTFWISNSIKVYNITEFPSTDINKDFVRNGYRHVQVLNAGNGSYWYLTANSTNLLSSINTYVGGVAISKVNFSNVIEFNASFSEVISSGEINLSIYSPITRNLNHTNTVPVTTTNEGSEIFVYNWDISNDANQYGVFKAQMFWNNDTAAGFIASYFVVVGDTSLNILKPADNSIFLKGETFNITVEYNDIIKSEGIIDAEVEYSLDGGSTFNSTAVQDIGNGRYNLTIWVNDPDFLSYGFVDVLISASENYYVNLTETYTFHRQITTNIEPSNSVDLGSIIRGLNISYTFDYYDTDLNYITGASWSVVGSSYNFISFLQGHGNGTYTIHLDTDNVNVGGSPYIFMFNISKIGKETQIIQLTIDVEIIQTRIESPSWTYEIARNSGLNQTFNFYFNDTTSDIGIPNLSVDDIIVRDNNTGVIWAPGWELINPLNDGWYILNISLTNKNSGWYTLEVNASRYPNYAESFSYLTFYLRGNYSQIYLKSVTDLGGPIKSVGAGYNYTIFEGSDIIIEFNITDTENDNKLITTLADSYTIHYLNLITSASGLLANSFQIVSQNHRGSVTTSNPALTIGYYEINITVNKLNYEEVSFVFNLTIIQKCQANLSIVKPVSVNAGLPFTIIIKAEYFNGTWRPISGSSITVIPYYNGIAGTPLGPSFTNSTGEIQFIIPTYSNTRTLNLTIQLSTTYYHQAYSIEISDISIIPRQDFTFEDFIPYIIIGAIIAAAIGGSVGIYRGVVVPKKREKTRILTEVKTIFDDAINLEHILVLYKGTGTCIYFKSFGSEQIDPELISGFISAISSFGKDLVSQEELNEISYGDKMLLLSDGEYIRVALVLGKKASLILRRSLTEFIYSFEKNYINALPNWRGQLNIFRDAGIIVDDVLSTSIILPHEITYEHSTTKALKKPQSRDVLKIANNLMKASERNFFFIATLLKEATEKTGKDTAQIFMGIKELRDKKILMPIEIAAIEAKPISQQELNLINQRVTALVSLSPEEKQKLVNDLSQMGPAEREAYFVSLSERHEIVSAPVEAKVGAAVIDNVKAAKKEIKNLKKNGLLARKEKDYDNTIKIFQNAFKIASTWELAKEAQEFDDLTRMVKIEDLKNKMKTLEKEARLAAKGENYNEASQKYRMASKIASEIFKLGEDLTKEVKRLSNKAKEYERLV